MKVHLDHRLAGDFPGTSYRVLRDQTLVIEKDGAEVARFDPGAWHGVGEFQICAGSHNKGHCDTCHGDSDSCEICNSPEGNDGKV